MTDYLTDVYFVQLRDTRFLVSHNILRLFPQTMLRSLFPMGLSLLCQRLCTASEAGLLPQQDPDVPNASRVSSGSSSSSGWSRDLGQASDDTNDIDSDDSDDESEHFEHKDRMHYPFAKKLEPLDPSPPLHKLLVLDSDPHVFWFMTQSLLLIMLRNERIYTRMMRLDEMARKGSAWSLKDTNKGKANNGKDSRESLKVAKSYQGLAESALDPLATVLTFERKDSGTVLTDIDSIQDWTQLRSMMVPIRSLVILHETIDFYILDVSKESRKKNRKPRRSWTAPFRLSSESVSAADQGESLPLDDIDADLVRKFKRAVGQRLQGQSTIFSGLDVNCKEHFTGLQMFESIETCTNASKDSCWDYRALEKGKARVKSYSLQVLESLPGVSSPLSQSAPIGSSKGPVASKSNETSPLVADDDDDDNVKLSQIVTQVQGPSSPEEDADSALDFKSHLKERKPFGKVWWEPYTLSVYQDAVSKEWISVPSLAQPPLASVSELRHLRLWLRRSWQIEFSSL